MRFTVAITGNHEIKLPQWGRSFWQDPNDGEIFLAYASGNTEVDYITSADSGNSWTDPSYLFSVDNWKYHNNFDTFMDRRGHLHCGFRYNGSGCYQFVGKLPGGGWTLASGIGPIGVSGVDDSGPVGGFCGSLVVQEAPNSVANEAGIQFPAMKMAMRDASSNISAYILGYPYQKTPDVEPMSAYMFAEVDGGFPIITTNSARVNSNPTSEIIEYDLHRHIIRRAVKGWGGDYYDNGTTPLAEGDVGFTQTMAFASGLGIQGSDGLILACSASGQSMFMSADNGFGSPYIQRVTSSYATDLTTPPDTNPLTNGTDVQTWRKVPRLDHVPGSNTYLPMDTGVAPTGGIYGVGPNTFSASGVPVHNFFPTNNLNGGGTNCDVTINNDNDIIFYFQAKNREGKQCIARVKGSHDYSTPSWRWAPGHIESGVKYIAPANKEFTGGWDHQLFWGGFKSLRHPTEPGDGSNKAEFLVTQGWTATYPSGGVLTVWNVAESPAVTNPYERPTFSLDYNATSGAPGINVWNQISALENFLFVSHKEQANNIFDDDLDTYANVRDRYVIEIELDKPREINRMEALYRTLTRSLEISVSGSFDQTNWSRVAVFPSGRFSYGANEGSPLYKVSAKQESILDDQGAPDKQPIIGLEPFAAKYVRFEFRSTYGLGSSIRLHDLRLYGPGGTEPEIVRWNHDHTTDPHDIREIFLRDNKATKIETFEGVHEGDLPAAFRTYGDFNWSVVGSGDAVLQSSASTATIPPGYDGVIPSGFFNQLEVNRGFRGDGFSLRSEAIGTASGLGNPLGAVPPGGIQPGHSGIVEIDVYVKDNEIDAQNSDITRDISFQIQQDTHNDDRIEFWTISPNKLDSDLPRIPTLRATYTGDTFWEPGNWNTHGGGDGPREATPQHFSLNNVRGNHTLRWIYYKGEYDEPQENTLYSFGACWIDYVSGIDASPINYVKGFLRGADNFNQQTVHGYLEGKGASEVHGYLEGGNWHEQIHGYLSSQVEADATSDIHGYIFGNLDKSIHGYLLSTSGVTTLTYPTSSIHGYVAVPEGADPSVIKGYVEGDWGRNIHGYLRGFSSIPGSASGDQIINSYVKAFEAVSSIHGNVNASGLNVINESVHGFVQSRFGLGDQVIHGYVFAPEGGVDSILGMTLGWRENSLFFRDPQTMIYGHVEKSNNASGAVHGYVIANFPNSDIHGYLGSEALVSSGGGLVGGGPGGGGSSTSNVVPNTNWTHGYVKGFDGHQLIHGYIMAPPGGVSLRKGYVSAGASDDRIYGFIGAHDLAATGIYGFVSGIEFLNEPVHGFVKASSGDIFSNILGHLVGSMDATSIVLGTLIGTEADIDNSQEACPSHNFPLSAVPTVVIPSSFFVQYI